MPSKLENGFIIFVLVMGFIGDIKEAHSLTINRIEGPSVVKVGSGDPLILDCEYEFNEEDKPGLVVKWYYNREPKPVFQWIPPIAPQAMGILRDEVDLEHPVSDDEYKKHRALVIRKPVPRLTGEYTCWVSSWQSEDYMRKDVVIYSPTRGITLNVEKTSVDAVEVSCRADGLYPEPSMQILRTSSFSSSDIELKSREEILLVNGTYSISVTIEIFDIELEDDETTFTCQVEIPEANYFENETASYYRGASTLEAKASEGVKVIESLSCITTLLLISYFVSQ